MAGFDPISNILGFLSKAADKIWPDKNEAEKNKVRLTELAMTGQLEELKVEANLMLQQMVVNTEEAKHASWFVAGWRPGVGWVCAVALGYHYVLQPFIVFLLGAFGYNVAIPVLDMGELMTLLMGMLGFGALRTFEKTRTNGKNGGK